MDIGVSITIAPRRAWLPSRMVWKNYRWIDRWIADLHPQISKNAYLEEIGYASAETMFLLMRTLHEPDAEDVVSGIPPEPDEPSSEGWRRSRPAHPFAKGDRLEHASFGVGTVTEVEPGGVIVVKFGGDSNPKKLMADYAPIRRI